jgi:hypothetical protein
VVVPARHPVRVPPLLAGADPHARNTKLLDDPFESFRADPDLVSLVLAIPLAILQAIVGLVSCLLAPLLRGAGSSDARPARTDAPRSASFQ